MAAGSTKRKVSLTLDEDVVVALQEDERTLSAVVNDAMRKHVRHMQQRRALRSMLDHFDDEDGPLDDDPAEDERLAKLFEAAG